MPALTVKSLLTFVVIGTLNASVTWLAVMLKTQAAPCGNTVSGVSVRCAPLPVSISVTGLASQLRENAPGKVLTDSLNVTRMSAAVGTFTVPSAGTMETTVGGEAVGSSVWKVTSTSAGNAFAGGSLSITPLERMVKVQVSTAANIGDGVSV